MAALGIRYAFSGVMLTVRTSATMDTKFSKVITVL
jgi:hypothetical protein